MRLNEYQIKAIERELESNAYWMLDRGYFRMWHILRSRV